MQLAMAMRHLDAGRFQEALDALGTAGAAEGPLAAGIRLTAEGLRLAEAGDGARADERIREARRVGVPLRSTLRQWGRYHLSRGQYEEAHQCFALLHSIEPRAIREFVTALPADRLVAFAPWVIGALTKGRRPELYALLALKHALVDRLGAREGAGAFADMAGRPPGWRVVDARVTSLHDFARRHAAEYHELYPGRSVWLPRPPGPRAAGEPIRARSRTVFRCVLEDVVVSSKSNFIVAGDRALLDFQGDELEAVPQALDVDPAVFGPEGDRVTVLVDATARAAPLEQAFSLLGVNSYNFGHWLVEFLPKVLACLDRPGFASVPVLIDEQMIPQHREALELLVGPDQPIVVVPAGASVRVQRLWACSMVLDMQIGPKPGAADTGHVLPIDGEAFAGLVARAAPALDAVAPTDGPRRIFLTRRDTQHRRMVNRPEVEAWFAGQGFELLDFGALPFRRQLALARGAEVIAGPDGSALWIAFFAGRGTRLGMLNNPALEEHWWIAAVCRSLGQPLSILTGSVVREHPAYRKFSDYEIDVGALPQFLDHLLASR